MNECWGSAVATAEWLVTGGAQIKLQVKIPRTSGSIPPIATYWLGRLYAVPSVAKVSSEARFEIFIPCFQILGACLQIFSPGLKVSKPASKSATDLCRLHLGLKYWKPASNSRGSPRNIQTGVPIHPKKQLVPASLYCCLYILELSALTVTKLVTQT